MFKLCKFLKPLDWLIVVTVMILIGGQTYFDLFLPDRIQNIIAAFTVTSTGTIVKPTVGQIWIDFAYIFLFAFGSFICMLLTAKASSYISGNYATYIRGNLFNHINTFSQVEVDKFSVPSLINRNTNDISKATMGLNMALRLAIGAPASAVGGILKIALDNSDGGGSGDTSKFALLVGCGLGVMIIVLVIAFVLVIPKFGKMQTLLDDLNNNARENISGIRIVRAFNAQDFHSERFEDKNKKTYKVSSFANCVISSGFPFIIAMMSFIILGIYWLGAYLLHTNDPHALDLPALIKFGMLSTIVLGSFIKLIMLFFFIPSAIISGKRINAVFNTKNTILSSTQDGKKNLKGLLEFKDVSFKFDGASESTISNINFTVNKGETLAIIGSTGSGKTTIINLIPRLFDSSNGTISVDGVDIKKYNTEKLRDKIGFIPQKNFLFNTSIKENIGYGINDKVEKVDIKKIKWASKVACADEFISNLNNKYDHVISQNGTNLSGGQKQRIAIARAVIRQPEILIFDDSFSALDMKTDQKVRENIKKDLKNTTKVIVAQRIGSIMDADKILVIDKGKEVGYGNHEELMKKCKVYKDIALSQLSRKELTKHG